MSLLEEVKFLVALAALALAVASIVWQGGKVARVVEQLGELIKDHETRLRALEKATPTPAAPPKRSRKKRS
jgi:hypothetical protein